MAPTAKIIDRFNYLVSLLCRIHPKYRVKIAPILLSIAGYLLYRRVASLRKSQRLLEGNSGSVVQGSRQPRAVRLDQVYPLGEDTSEPDLDIIAIHGLDTKSPDTWIWDNKSDPKVNWLADPDMLPRYVGRARIFTCDWPSDLWESPHSAQKTIQEFALLLLHGIKHRPRGITATQNTPIVFIASCLGGIILMQALTLASGENEYIREATRGILFLATPFRNTSFKDVAAWAEPGLSVLGALKGQRTTKLLQNVKDSTFVQGALVREFTALSQSRKYHLRTTYETGHTSLRVKAFPWLPKCLRDEKPVRIAK